MNILDMTACVAGSRESRQLLHSLQQPEKPPSKPLVVTDLLQDLKALKAVVAEASFANAWLRSRLKVCLPLMPPGDAKSKLLAQLKSHGWDENSQSFCDPNAHVDLVRLIGHLQRWLYEKLEQVNVQTANFKGVVSSMSSTLMDDLLAVMQCGSGTYSIVHRARNRETSEVLVIKKLIHTTDTSSGGAGGGFADCVIREISILREMRHENVIQ